MSEPPKKTSGSDFEAVDYFVDPSVVPDPYPYFDFLRSKCPVVREPHHGVLAITGHPEALAAYKDPAFSACNSVVGPFAGLPFEPEGDGIPAEDHEEFRAAFSGNRSERARDDIATEEHNPLQWLNDKFSAYIADRRREPRNDVLTELAEAKYPDGSTPEAIEVVRLATFVFAAGQETTAKLLGFAMRTLAEQPEAQATLRQDRERIPAFIEETLRMESPVKSHFRTARHRTSIGDVAIPAGATVMLLPGASNRDSRKFADPDMFRIDRPNVREHIAFGRGIHSCPGAPLARAEGQISINRILDRIHDIRISESIHGAAAERRYTYEPTWQMRGLTHLYLDFKAD
jgi:cytochrome P450